MSQTPITFPSEVPASLRCGFCGQLINGVFFRTFKRFTCQHCAAQAKLAADRNAFDPASFTRAAIAGSLVAIGGAVAWATIVHVTNWEIGIVASFIGVLVGKAVYAASGKRRGTALQRLCAVLSVFGVIAGKFIFVGWGIFDQAKSEGQPISVPALISAMMMHPDEVFKVFDLVWAGIAVYAGWRICKPLQIVVAGPYRYEPKNAPAPAAAGPLQFDTVEPEQTEPA